MPQIPNCGNNATPTPPEINTVAFQAAVSAVVTAALAQVRNGNNGDDVGQGIRSTNHGTKHRATRTYTYKDFTNAKPRTLNGTGGVIALKRWIEKVESVFEICGCPDECKVKFASYTFTDQALSWWNGHIEAMTLPMANALPWEELKEMILAEYCPRGEIQKMEHEQWNLTVQNSDIDVYISRFSELSLLCPGMITSEGKNIERFIWGLTAPIQGNVIAENPETFDSAKRLAKKLYDHGNKKGAQTVEVEVKKEGENKKGKKTSKRENKTRNHLRNNKRWLFMRQHKLPPHHMLQPHPHQMLQSSTQEISPNVKNATSTIMGNAER
ncbi:uncharacterized protein LOC111886928 [Lactuca sativa]|uniref:uncharacterized protein LOC111886928 n=1 Tax=Lactuca sativa TaxID=4236 RepID=UPI000CD928AB|nr:uncharacterized protein LOC111886928 [Lactuca sativa]